MTRAELETRAGQVLEGNWTGTYTKPSSYHYPDLFLWDSCFAAIINARRKEPQIAGVELQTLLQGIDPRTGFIPNRRLIGTNGSNYTQPPLLAHAAWDTYKSYQRKGEHEQGKKFLQDIYGEIGQEKVSGLKGAYGYFQTYRENGNGSKLIGVIHPHETGMDSSPPLKQGALWIPIPQHGIIANLGAKEVIPIANTGLDLLNIATINARASFLYQWNIKKMREKVYWVNDVMFNTLYVTNLFYMAQISAELGRDNEPNAYKDLAKQVEAEILEKMWNQDDRFFYNLDKNGDQIPIASISGLFPLTLEGISKHQLTYLLDKMEDQEWFNTPYPIPSLPAYSKYYDPHRKTRRLWRGPVSINTNYILAEEGIVKQIERFKDDEKLSRRMLNYLDHLVSRTEDLVSENDFREFYDPENGKGLRVENFTWAILALHFDKSKALLDRGRKEAVAAS